MVRSQLFVDDLARRYYRGEIQSFVNAFNNKLFPAFSNIEEEAEKVQNDSFERCLQWMGEYADGGDAADHAINQGLEYYETMNLVKYSFTAISIAALYHLWEQQVRKFLHKEMSHVFTIEFANFCPRGMADMKKMFLAHNLNLELLKCFPKIDELRLLSNVIKHGDGGSAKELYGRRNDLFKIDYNQQSYAPPLDTTLLEETLNLSQAQFNEYAEVLVSFWDELPERSYSDPIDEEQKSPGRT